MLKLKDRGVIDYRTIKGALFSVIAIGSFYRAGNYEQGYLKLNPSDKWDALPLEDKLNAIATVLQQADDEKSCFPEAWYVVPVIEQGIGAFRELIGSTEEEDWKRRLLLQAVIEMLMEVGDIMDASEASMNHFVDNLGLSGKFASLADLTSALEQDLAARPRVPQIRGSKEEPIAIYLRGYDLDHPEAFSGLESYNYPAIPQMTYKLRQHILQKFIPRFSRTVQAIEAILLDRYCTFRHDRKWLKKTDPQSRVAVLSTEGDEPAADAPSEPPPKVVTPPQIPAPVIYAVEERWGLMLPFLHDDILEKLAPGYYDNSAPHSKHIYEISEQDILWANANPPAWKFHPYTEPNKGGYLSCHDMCLHEVWGAFNDLMRKGVDFLVSTSEGRVTYARLRWILDRASDWPDDGDVRMLVEDFDLDPYIGTYRRSLLYSSKTTAPIERDHLRREVGNLLNLGWIITGFNHVKADGTADEEKTGDHWTVQYGRRKKIKAVGRRVSDFFRPFDIDRLAARYAPQAE